MLKAEAAAHKALELEESLADAHSAAACGDREEAFASLERAYAAHDAQLTFLRVDGNLDPLRSDSRFHDLMRRVGLRPRSRFMPAGVVPLKPDVCPSSRTSEGSAAK